MKTDKISGDVIEGYKNSSPNTRIIILCCIVIIVVVSIFSWLNYQSNLQDAKLINNLTIMIRNQEKEDFLKKCVLEEFRETENFFNIELLGGFGKVFSQNNILFPQDLNLKIQGFRLRFGKIKDCLILPEE